MEVLTFDPLLQVYFLFLALDHEQLFRSPGELWSCDAHVSIHMPALYYPCTQAPPTLKKVVGLC